MKALLSSLALTLLILGGIAAFSMGVIASRSRQREAILAVYRHHIAHCADCQREGMTPEALADAEGQIPGWVWPPDPSRPVEEPPPARILVSNPSTTRPAAHLRTASLLIAP
jgi:hypothetical protein